MAATIASTEPQGRAAPSAVSGFVHELHGLRGIALTLVVLFHLFGNGRVSGGVDVFLFITGFLAARGVIARVTRPGYSLAAQYSRSASRLVPPATLVVLVVGIAALVILPSTRWLDLGREVAASALYFQNWQLIWTGLHYGAVGGGADPLQHFWSLSIQGQFLLLWPLAVLAIVAIARRSADRLLLWFTAVTTVASFGYAAYLISVSPAVAYFDSFARYWELGAGALLAMLLPFLRVPGWLGAVFGVVGLVVLVSCGFFVDGLVAFPGPLALLPVGAAALVILGAGARGPARSLLLSRPLTWIADISYGLFLWHWPIAVLEVSARGHSELGLTSAFVVLGASVVLAVLTRLLLEKPILRRRASVSPRRLLVLVLVPAVVVGGIALAGVGALSSAIDRERALMAVPSVGNPGAAVGPETGDGDYRPSTWFAPYDVPLADGEPCPKPPDNTVLDQEAVLCTVLDPADPALDVLMIGGSHVEEWIPAFEQIGRDRDWRVTAIVKNNCRWELVETPADACEEWGRSVTDLVETLSPDVIVVNATWTDAVGTESAPSDLQLDAWQTALARGIPMMALRDNPRFSERVPDCVTASTDPVAECGRARAEIFGDLDALTSDIPGEVAIVDETDLLCTDQWCPPIIGDVLAYRDHDHFTATFVRSLSPSLEERMADCTQPALAAFGLCASG